MTTRLARAVCEARRIRGNLVRLRGETDLGGDCGLASVLLADALADVSTLRHTEDTRGRFETPHVWNEIDGVIVDVTATQFNDSMRSNDAGEPAVFGVLVTREPRVYHLPVAGRGRQTLAYLFDADWYEDQDHRRLLAAMKRLSSSSGYRTRPGPRVRLARRLPAEQHLTRGAVARFRSCGSR